MARYLIVANKTLGGEQLLKEVRSRIESGEAKFHVLIPANAPEGELTYTEGQAQAGAEARLKQELDRLKALGAEVSGEVGDGDPVNAIKDLGDLDYDEIILCTHPPGISRWLNMDVISRVEGSVNVPVTHVIVEQG